MRRIMLCLSAIFLCVSQACQSVGQYEDTRNITPTYIEVDNENVMDVIVYIVRNGGIKIRLGDVTSFTTRSFPIHDDLLNTSLSFRVNELAGTSWDSDQFSLNSPIKVKLTVMRPMTFSHFEIY